MPVSVAARILIRSASAASRSPRGRPSSTVLNGSTFASFRLRLHERRHAVEAVHHLRVHRMLDPQRAVLVEGGDALRRRHELRAARSSWSSARTRRSPAWPHRRSTTAADRSAQRPARQATASAAKSQELRADDAGDSDFIIVVSLAKWSEANESGQPIRAARSATADASTGARTRYVLVSAWRESSPFDPSPACRTWARL